MSSVVLPLLQVKLYGVVPPDIVISIEPLFAPQLAFVVLDVIETALEPETETVAVAVQLLRSLTVTV